jgi:hypothetical protein
MLSDGGAHQTSSNATGNVMTHIGQKLSLFIGTIAATAGLLSAASRHEQTTTMDGNGQSSATREAIRT